MIPDVASASTLAIFKPTPKLVLNLSTVSLVTEFLKLFVITLPRGDLSAYDLAAIGFSSMLSLSCCGYKSAMFCEYSLSVNSSSTATLAFVAKR